MSKFKFGKCSQCGCTGVHACLGKPVLKQVDMPLNSKYSTIEEAIEHIRKSEAKQKKERKNGRPGSSR